MTMTTINIIVNGDDVQVNNDEGASVAPDPIRQDYNQAMEVVVQARALNLAGGTPEDAPLAELVAGIINHADLTVSTMRGDVRNAETKEDAALRRAVQAENSLATLRQEIATMSRACGVDDGADFLTEVRATLEQSRQTARILHEAGVSAGQGLSQQAIAAVDRMQRAERLVAMSDPEQQE